MRHDDFPVMRLGIDIDGVLADFNTGFHNLLEVRTRRGIPYHEPEEWYWPKAWGYTKEEEDGAWDAVRESEEFWYSLKPMTECQLAPVIPTLLSLVIGGHEVYFLTSRPGKIAQAQTIGWLIKHGFPNPIVLITDNAECKGYVAKGLKLTHLIDDKPENCFTVVAHSPKTKVFMMKRPWNDKPQFITQAFGLNIPSVSSMRDFFAELVKEQPIALTGSSPRLS